MSATASGPPASSRSSSLDAFPLSHTLLAKFDWPGETPVASLRARALRARVDAGSRTRRQRGVRVHRAPGRCRRRAFDFPTRAPETLPHAALSRLALLQEVAGASAGEAAPYHYVVETDVREESEADLNDWYEREHLPGLASVPGTARAMRFRNLHGRPRYHACYDLVRPETLGSPPWLAVRGTPWSDRVRPAFYNTKRTMFRRV